MFLEGTMDSIIIIIIIIIIAGNRLLGPYSLPPLLTGAVYYDFPRKVVPELFQDMDLQITVHA